MRIILKLKLAAKQHSEILLRRLFLRSPSENWAEKERKISLTYEEQTYISDSAININPFILKCSRICYLLIQHPAACLGEAFETKKKSDCQGFAFFLPGMMGSNLNNPHAKRWRVLPQSC